jgi:hypothetical protein
MSGRCNLSTGGEALSKSNTSIAEISQPSTRAKHRTSCAAIGSPELRVCNNK